MTKPKLISRHATHRRLECGLMLAVLVLLLAAVAGPYIAQPASYHDFADKRLFWHIPFTMDVLSNLPFLLWGIVGLWTLVKKAPGAVRAGASDTSQAALAGLFFIGLVVTAVCSSWYHLNPANPGLAIDRVGMVIAFAGLLGLAVGGRAGRRAGLLMALAVLVFGPLSVAAWVSTGNVMPWVILQFGGLALIACCVFIRPADGALDIRWGLVVAIYAAAKVFELADVYFFELAGHVVSGHSIKHVLASCAAWPVVHALSLRRSPGVVALATSKQGRIGFAAQ